MLAVAAALLRTGAAAGADAAVPLSPTDAAASAPPQRPRVQPLRPSLSLRPAPTGEAARQLPIILRAQRIQSTPDIETIAEGDAEFRRGGLLITADRLAYENPLDLASAVGQVRVQRDGAVYTGPELQLRLQRFEGFFRQPTFEFTKLGSGGRAERIDFIDNARFTAVRAEYTSCPREGPLPPDWILKAERVDLDLDANEGVAKNAVLRFLGVPILALPTLSFPLSDARKTGWLPPSISTDSKSGVEVSVPFYWNIAPNRDATLTPRLLTRRGPALDTEFRYLQPADSGAVRIDWLPHDRITGSSRDAVTWTHAGQIGTDPRLATRYAVDLTRVSDDSWWKDFPGSTRSFTPRLLPLRAALEQPFSLSPSAGRLGGWLSGEGLAYARVLQWQALQASDLIVVAPYERTPQVGVQFNGATQGWVYGAQTEYNRFTLPSGEQARDGREGGDRVHLLANLSRPVRGAGWWVVPQVSVNSASYGIDSDTARNGTVDDRKRRESRTVPTISIDSGMRFERPTQLFGRAFEQTLEPRLLYVRTPFVDQSGLPNYDSAAKDFNFNSIYSNNSFSGIDRVADANQLTVGVTTRYLDASTGAEALRLGVVQRVLFETQRITPQADGTPGGEPFSQRFSDALLLGSTSLLPKWNFDAAIQYSPDLKRSVRSIVGVRYAPGPFRTVSVNYRLARGLNEQLEVAWQWPVWGNPDTALRGVADGSCKGSWYAVGRVNYSLKDSRITDSVLGAEYDAGCWIGRVVAERLSTGRSEATTRLMVQLELIGLSRLGSNPLKVLKDNIPGYRLLREERTAALPFQD
ncbi:MAG: LPS assembly protein LptD [Rubrivivax sp.]